MTPDEIYSHFGELQECRIGLPLSVQVGKRPSDSTLGPHAELIGIVYFSIPIQAREIPTAFPIGTMPEPKWQNLFTKLPLIKVG